MVASNRSGTWNVSLVLFSVMAYGTLRMNRKPSRRDTYGLKTLQPGEVRRVEGKSRDQFRRVLASYVKRHPELLRKVFDWQVVGQWLEVRRIQ